MTEPAPSPVHARRRRVRTALVIATTIALTVPATAFATGGFTDVKSSDFFSGAVGWMAENGVTAGCNPNASPPNTKYCPGDFVTRGQMAVFLERLDSQNVFLRPGDVSMEDGGGDADTLDGKDSTAFLLKTQKAADANKLDGKDSTAFLGKTEQAADADTVDGLEASQLRAGVPVAQAHVSGQSIARGFGFVSATRVSTGTYCVTLDPSLGLTAVDVIATVSVEWGSSNGNDLLAFWRASATGCATGEIAVLTYDSLDNPVLSNDVSFVVTVTPLP